MAANDCGAASVEMLGGMLCLDFANTVGDHLSDRPSDYLANYQDLVAWSQRAGILGSRAAQQLLDEAAQHPAAATAVFHRAVALREAIYRIFASVAADGSPKTADLDLLNEALANALQHARVVSTRRGFRWDWSDEIALDRIIWPVARSTADLLTSGNLDRVSQCSDAVCGWLFIDTSKNHSRRWCSMGGCGNRAKARRHYERTRKMKTISR